MVITKGADVPKRRTKLLIWMAWISIVEEKLVMINTDRKTVSIIRACELAGVSRRTIYNWINGGKVDYVRTAGGSVRIYLDTLFREGQSVPSTETAEKTTA